MDAPLPRRERLGEGEHIGVPGLFQAGMLESLSLGSWRTGSFDEHRVFGKLTALPVYLAACTSGERADGLKRPIHRFAHRLDIHLVDIKRCIVSKLNADPHPA